MNPLFKSLLEAQALAEEQNSFRQNFEYTLTAMRGTGTHPFSTPPRNDRQLPAWDVPQLVRRH